MPSNFTIERVCRTVKGLVPFPTSPTLPAGLGTEKSPVFAELGLQTPAPLMFPQCPPLNLEVCLQWTPVTLGLKTFFLDLRICPAYKKGSTKYPRVVIYGSHLQLKVGGKFVDKYPTFSPFGWANTELCSTVHHPSEFPSRSEFQLPSWKPPWKCTFYAFFHSLSRLSLPVSVFWDQLPYKLNALESLSYKLLGKPNQSS